MSSPIGRRLNAAAFDVSFSIMPEAVWSGKQRSVLCGLLAIASLMLIGPSSSAAADCAPEPQSEGRVVAAIDHRTLRLEDGRLVRLAGLAPLDGRNAVQSQTALGSIAAGRTVSLHGESDAPDRYGRQRAWVFAEGMELSLQAALVAAGGGLRDVPIADEGCRSALESAENAAKTARLGLWAASGPIKNAESPDDISAEIGHFRVIEGRVRSVRPSGGVTYLNFGRRWVEGFAVMVPKRAEAAFDAAGLPLKAFEGQRLSVRGYLMRRGGPRIEALGPEQIEVVGGSAGATTGTKN